MPRISRVFTQTLLQNISQKSYHSHEHLRISRLFPNASGSLFLSDQVTQIDQYRDTCWSEKVALGNDFITNLRENEGIR